MHKKKHAMDVKDLQLDKWIDEAQSASTVLIHSTLSINDLDRSGGIWLFGGAPVRFVVEAVVHDHGHLTCK